MQFTFTPEQLLIREAAQDFFREHGSAQRVRAAMETKLGYDEETWQAMAQEMGWTGITLPESCGGMGLGHVELAILQEEAGRWVHPSPFFNTVCLAAPAILLAATPAQREALLRGIAEGRTRAALVLTGPEGKPGLDGIGITLKKGPRGFTLSGVASYVVYGHAADLLVVAARAPRSRGTAGVSLVALPADTAGVSIEKLVTLDLTRPMARITFNRVSVAAEQILGEEGAAAEALQTALRRAQIALAAEQTGGAQAALDLTVAYAKERVQFGRIIGSFQAVKHRLADMMVEVESARSAAYYAACVADESSEELPEAAAIAKARCSDVFFKCAADMIQLHGGIGFTWEHQAHLYFKRARASTTLLGTPQHHREALASMIGLGSLA